MHAAEVYSACLTSRSFNFGWPCDTFWLSADAIPLVLGNAGACKV